jgi:putative cardiolipin synthase
MHIQSGPIRAFLKAQLLILLMVALLGGCATLPEHYPHPESVAYPDYQETSVGRFFEEAAAAQHPGESGFVIVRKGHDAFTGRIAMTKLAERSIDVQYYIWESDATGRILADQLVRAADRGVRVRALVDDNNLEGRDAIVAALDAHPNIEIRVFNPFANRDRHVFDFLVDLDRINHRMHNKLMVMDNAVAIIGGRNIGNHYFGVATDANFRDLDIATVGPLVRDTSSVFDYFWNGSWSVPILALVERPYDETDLQAAIETVRNKIAEDPYPYDLDQDVDDLTAALASIRERLVWAPGRIVWDLG